jgi:hypothetical protein
MVMGALASFLPKQVMACSQGTSAFLTLGDRSAYRPALCLV